MKIRTITIAAVLLATGFVAALCIKCTFVAQMAEGRAIHGYNGICNYGVGEPYEDFIRQLRMMAERGDTNRLATVLRRADEHSGDISEVWLDRNREAYRKSINEILK